MARKKKKTAPAKVGGVGWGPVGQWMRAKLTGPGGTAAAGRLGRLLVLGIIVAGGLVGLRFLDGYVKNVVRQHDISLTVSMVDPPQWASEELIRQVCLSSGIHSDDFLLDADLTAKWAGKLVQNPWVKQVRRIHKRSDGQVIFDLALRRPVAMVRQGSEVRYIDDQGVVLSALPLRDGPAGHLVELTGAIASVGRCGDMVPNAIVAGIRVLAMIRVVDSQLPGDQRLWDELARIDVSNYDGRQDPARPHLMLYTDNQTEVRWGAAVDKSVAYHEAEAKSKIATLYRKHQLAGSLSLFPFIELRDGPLNGG